MGLSGRLSKDVGLVATSKIYQLKDRTCVFTPQNLDSREFYLVNDVDLFSSTLRSDVAMLRANWKVPGRPTMVVTLGPQQIVDGKVPVSLRQTIKKLVGGYVHGTRVCVSRMGEFFSTSCVASLEFLSSYETGEPDIVPAPIRDYVDNETGFSVHSRSPGSPSLPYSDYATPGLLGSPTSGVIRQSRSLTGLDSPGSGMLSISSSQPHSQAPSRMISRRSSSDDVPVRYRAVSELRLEQLLFNLSPYETQSLLLAILSGREQADFRTLSAQDSFVATKHTAVHAFVRGPEMVEGELEVPVDHQPQGQWLRRRRLDGALNRVPVGFYSRVWAILERCPGVWIRGQCLPWALTREMTPGEFKFALRVEEMLNRIPEPEYRQLLVETLMVLSLVVENDTVDKFCEPLDIEMIVRRAHALFIEDQRRCSGDATLCCCVSPPVVPCQVTVGICERFYDSAPSGSFGTMTYIVRALAYALHDLTSATDCTVS
ncbi:hypothetical protein HPB52_025401 [Rhipicephalus sanguineus]|uniref:Phosphorylase b kinase regulatory subunit n=1 Tax=Rhipicephalus sanguineus TaxID=34632 RepID=A0A9D4TCY7_RHISA|nr:hypothetical protein HPB52_025401 [Rhipicephalus sanguineus]